MKSTNVNLKSLFAVITMLFVINGMLCAQNRNALNSISTANAPTTALFVSSEEGASIARPDVTVVPNPSSGPVTVRFTATVSGKIGITVMNSNGSAMFVIEGIAKVGSNQIAIDLTSYGSGNYPIVVSGAGVYGKVVAVIK
ncbi:MAG: hypothetical protein IPO83_16510 [Chitinophagaceae bacterium]|nr:hypothetical protein [Chitinophagaceae bacterium]